MGESCKLEFTKEKIEKHFVNSPCRELPIFFYGELDSTNLAARRYVQNGGDGAALFVAERQSAGRGRLGRSFISDGGVGLYMSLLLPLDFKFCDTLTALAAVKCAEAIERLTDSSVDIKWVNDIYKNGRKLAGILCESFVKEIDGTAYVVIGVGVNVFARRFQPEIENIAGSLEAECGRAPSRAELCAEIAKGILHGLVSLGTEELRSAYKSRLLWIGEEITVHSASGDYKARFLDIDRDCALIAERDGKNERIFTGEVSIRHIET